MCFSFKSLVIAAFAAVLLFNKPSSAKDVFKGSDFLEWSRHNQESYISNSAGMAVLILGRFNKEQALCMSDLFDDEQSIYDFALESIAKFPDYHPRGTILAVLEKRCGKVGN